MIYWSTRKKGLVFYYNQQPKVWLTKDGWNYQNATIELIKKYQLLTSEVYHYWLPKFSYSLVKDKVTAILEPYLTRLNQSTDLEERLMLASYICDESKDACIREISLTDTESALCLFFYKKKLERIYHSLVW